MGLNSGTAAKKRGQRYAQCSVEAPATVIRRSADIVVSRAPGNSPQHQGTTPAGARRQQSELSPSKRTGRSGTVRRSRTCTFAQRAASRSSGSIARPMRPLTPTGSAWRESAGAKVAAATSVKRSRRRAMTYSDQHSRASIGRHDARRRRNAFSLRACRKSGSSGWACGRSRLIGHGRSGTSGLWSRQSCAQT